MKLTFRLIVILLIMGTIAITGCGSPDFVDAEARNSSFQPEFGEATADKELAAGDAESASKYDLSFLHQDHFAVVRIKPDTIKGQADLAEIEWADLEAQLADLVGESNSKLDAVASFWIVVDQGYFESMTGGEGNGALASVVDFKKPFDEEALSESMEAFYSVDEDGKPLTDEEIEERQSAMSYQKISPTRLALGPKEAISKVANGNGNSELARLIGAWDEAVDVQASIVISPIRTVLQGFFDMAARFGGDIAKFAQLPDVVSDLTLKLDLKSDTLALLDMSIEDAELAKEIVKAINGFSGSAGAGGLSGMMAGGGQGFNQDLMFQPLSLAAISKVGKEIQDKQLFSAKAETEKIVLKLDRPGTLVEAISATISDGKKQMEIAERLQNLGRIGEALKNYEEKYGKLPSLNAIDSESSEELGVPAQFSWRVALLPFLDEQALYDRFDFAKSWDAPENLKLLDEMPEVFGDGTTSAFALVAGDASIYRRDRPQPQISDVSDREIWTAVIVESSQAKDWIEPSVDFVAESDESNLGLEDENGILFLNAKFQSRIVKRDNETVQKVWTSDGGEKMTSKDFIKLQR